MMNLIGHVVRKDDQEVLALTRKIKGKRSRGRKRMFWLTSLNECIRERGVKHQAVELIEVARNRELWQTMIADVS